MKVSIIAAVYKDVVALDIIVKALQQQTYKNFELIIAEDGDSQEMREYVKSIEGIEYKHTSQEDLGVRKARSQNNGIMASTGEYLIFIDGDCIPYTTFIAGHVALSQKRTVLSGRRANLPASLSSALREQRLSSVEIEESYLRRVSLMFDKTVRYKQGIYLNPEGFLYSLIAKRDISTSILGCNFSCYKSEMLAINGFDESYGETAVSDDVDLEWRFIAAGLALKSCKNVANMFHLDHRAHARKEATQEMQEMYRRKEAGSFVCKEGLNTHV